MNVDEVIEKKYTTQEDINRLCASLCQQIKDSGFKPDLIIGISRGGLIPGVMISHCLDVPFRPLLWSTRDHSERVSDAVLATEMWEGKNILVIDDICDSGTTMQEIEADWNSAIPSEVEWGGDSNVRTASLYYREGCTYNVDYVGEIVEGTDWIVFAWENWYDRNVR